MSQSLLKPGRNACGIFADACRIATLLSTGLALVFWGPDKVIAFLAVFAILVIPRMMRMPEPFDAAFAVTMYISTLTGALGWYENLDWWDKVAHVVTTGAAAAMVCLILSRYGLVDNLFDRSRRLFRSRVVLQTTAFGLSIAVTWEILEWFYKTVNSNDPPATYLDTMADMLGGAVGSVIAAFFLLGWAGESRQDATHESRVRQADPLSGSLSDLDDPAN
ncbi:hypothetical protein [Arthrobacter sp. H14]|uniref:hypothetical protein n=1 Tax=Arthrobacter sp. H14 TaxID=1312959 RepID=UPI0012DD1A9A|nr:hypothetical protein [Arthrobacter sp. H14]